MSKVDPIPEGFHTVTPHLIVKDCAKAIAHYKEAFGAEELMMIPAPDGRVMHAQIRIGDSVVMLADEYPEWGCNGPLALGGASVCIHLSVTDADAWFDRAVKAGAEVVYPVQEMFWGDRYGKVKDPFGHEWSFATQVKILSPEEIARAGAAAMSGGCG